MVPSSAVYPTTDTMTLPWSVHTGVPLDAPQVRYWTTEAGARQQTGQSR